MGHCNTHQVAWKGESSCHLCTGDATQDPRLPHSTEVIERLRQLLIRSYNHVAVSDHVLAAEIRKELWG